MVRERRDRRPSMDAARFDGIVKALASGTSRRRVMGGALGVLAVVLGAEAFETAEAKSCRRTR
jgi:hypothetical protein